MQLFGRVLEFLLYVPKIPVVKGKRVALHNKHHGVQEEEDSRDPVEIKVVDVNGERHGDESQLEDAHCNEPSPLPVDDPLFHQPVHENHEESAQEHCQVQHCDREQVRCHVLHDFQLIPCTAVRRIVICAAPDGNPAQEHPCEHVDPCKVRLQFFSWGGICLVRFLRSLHRSLHRGLGLGLCQL